MFDCLLESRRWDEGAKEPDWEVPGLEHYLPLVARAVVRPRAADASATKKLNGFVRAGNLVVGLRDDGGSELSRWRPPRPACEALRAPRQTRLLAQWASRGYVVLRRAEWLGDSPGARAENIGRVADAVEALPQAAAGAANGPFHTFERCDGVVRHSRTEAFADHNAEASAFLRGPTSRLESVVALLAGERVELLKEKINYKYGNGGGGYCGHQVRRRRIGAAGGCRGAEPPLRVSREGD